MTQPQPINTPVAETVTLSLLDEMIANYKPEPVAEPVKAPAPVAVAPTPAPVVTPAPVQGAAVTVKRGKSTGRATRAVRATWRRSPDKSAWLIQAPGGREGDTAAVMRKDGAVRHLTLGREVEPGLFVMVGQHYAPKVVTAHVCPGDNRCRTLGWRKGPCCS